MRRRTPLIVLAFALAACAPSAVSEPAPPSTKATLPPESTTSSANPPESVDRADGSAEIAEDGLLEWSAGTYRASAFWVPVSFTPRGEGWRSYGQSDLWVHTEYRSPGEQRSNLTLTVLAHRPADPIETEVEAIAGDPAVSLVAGPSETSVAGFRALVLDVVAKAGPGNSCGNTQPGNSRFQANDTGLILLTEGGIEGEGSTYGYGFGVRSCRAARIWAVDVDGSSIVVIAATTTEDDFGDLIGVAEELIGGMEFDV